MRDSGGAVLRKGLVGLVVGASVCYCVYRVISRKRKKQEAAGTEGETIPQERQTGPFSCGEHAVATPESSLLQRVSGISVISSTVQKGSGSLQQGMDFQKSPQGLEIQHIENLLHLLESTEDPSVQEQVLVTLSNCAAFSVNQDIIRKLGGLSVIGKILSVPVTNVKEKALNALNNLSMNTKNQEELKIYITHVCAETESSLLNSEVQLAGLRFLTNMSVTNEYHYIMTSSIPCFLHLLLEGNERTQVWYLTVLSCIRKRKIIVTDKILKV
ncbi:Armadillo repeat-containing protein 10 [Varanus komodoensis]|nr:Armadillo repeat-containing protein 10 [Varanus komodoensis]